MPHSLSRLRALGEFLRKHRELIEPTETRQFPSKRRRTPGLRREEVAQMAGISPSWYARLEQAEETATPSPTALDSIAKVLRLVPVERAYLFYLAGRVDPIHASGLNDKLVVSTVESFVLSISSILFPPRRVTKNTRSPRRTISAIFTATCWPRLAV